MLKKLAFFHVFAVIASLLVLMNSAESEPGSAEVMVPLASDLQSDGERAREKGIPVLIEFSMMGCPFCETVEEEVLKPMLLSGEYENKVIIRKVMIDLDNEVIIDFNGKKIAFDELGERYKIDVTPTLVLMDGEGRVVGSKMRGVTTIDYYGQYLDMAIDEALLQTSKKGLARKEARPASADSPAS